MVSLEQRILANCPGSPPNSLTWRERVAAIVRYWSWHAAAAAWLVLGLAADYLSDNFSTVERSVPKYASLAFGVIGLVRYYQRVCVMYPRDTRKEET